METGKPGLASALAHAGSAAAQAERRRMDAQAPVAAVYIHAVPALPAPPQEPAALRLAAPPLYSKETLPFLTLRIATGGLQPQPGLVLAAAAAAPPARPKSSGKHVCPHCGRDCMKPSVLEKHLRCHTGERPYPCTTCGVSFKTQSNLYKHRRTQAHARLSSESEQSSQGSQDSAAGSREAHEEAGEPAQAACSARAAEARPGERDEATPAGREAGPSGGPEAAREKENEKPSPPGRHLPLRRQEATLSSRRWESSRSHESMDSGFGESAGDRCPSPPLGHGADSPAGESGGERPEGRAPRDGPGDGERERGQKALEERISKLISENSAVVEDRQLENVRPRKTVLSKQGSIDLPMPYTYKDSFHFDMKIGKAPGVGARRSRRPGLYASVPTQHSASAERAPLTRSNSLPFGVALLPPEGGDCVALAHRGSSGQVGPPGFAGEPAGQQPPAHRPLVRQTAVDCNHAADGLSANSSVEEACDGGGGGDACGEPSGRKFRKKKAQKFAYNKWYMYGGGTFKKLYGAEKGAVDSGVTKGRKCASAENEAVPATNCPAAKLSLVSPVDLNRRTSQLQSLVAPLQRNLSLPVLSLASRQTDSAAGAEAGRPASEEKRSDPAPWLCAAHVPSDRKRQRTDDKAEAGTSSNALSHLPPSVAGAAPQQETNQNLAPIKGALLSPCIVNANSAPVSAMLAASLPSAVKTSFLPKYQLKLPNAGEPDSNAEGPAEDGGRPFASALSPSQTEQAPPPASSSERKCGDAAPSPSAQARGIQTPDVFSFTRAQLYLPRFSEGVLPSPPVAHRQPAAATVTTTCLRDPRAALRGALTVQPSHSAACRPIATVATSFPAVHPAPEDQAFAAAAHSRGQFRSAPLLSPPQISPGSDGLGPVTRAYASPNPSSVPCHVAPFHPAQPAPQNVFHVHTADLQISLQIISDEQLALIEPQIERRPVDAGQSSASVESGLEGRERQQLGHLTDSGDSEPSPPASAKSSSPTQATASEAAGARPPEAPGLELHSHVNMATEIPSSTDNVSSTAAPLEGVLAPEGERTLSLNHHPEGQLPLGTSIGQGGPVPPTPRNQPELNTTCLSPDAAAQNGTPSQGKDPGASRNASSTKTPALESTETCPSPRVKFTKADELPESLPPPSIQESKAPSEVNPPASVYSSDPPEPELSETPKPSERVSGVCDWVTSLDNSTPLREVTESLDVISSTRPEKAPDHFDSASSAIQVETPKEIPSIHNPTAGLTEEASPEMRTWGNGGVPMQPDGSRWGGNQSQDAREANHQRMNGQGGGVMREDATGGVVADQVPGRWGDGEWNCGCSVVADMTKPEGGDREVRVDSLQNSWLSEQQHLRGLSQTHSGMSEYPPQSPRQALSTSSNPPLPTSDFYPSQRNWESDTTHQTSNQQAQISCESGDRPDLAGKYQSFFLAGQLHGYQPAEGLAGGVRPVQSCQAYPEDTVDSSSDDDEGKLIIEL